MDINSRSHYLHRCLFPDDVIDCQDPDSTKISVEKLCDGNYDCPLFLFPDDVIDCQDPDSTKISVEKLCDGNYDCPLYARAGGTMYHYDETIACLNDG